MVVRGTVMVGVEKLSTINELGDESAIFCSSTNTRLE